jgi:hypothetical protein
MLAVLPATGAVQAASTASSPGIVVISPKSGDNWETGEPRVIQWVSTVVTGPTVRILLLKDGGAVKTINAGAPAFMPGIIGQYIWPHVDAEGLSGDGAPQTFQIKVESLDGKVFGVSSPFSIHLANYYFRFDNPRGGETFITNNSYQVSWSYHGYNMSSTSGQSIILKKRSSGQTWTVVAKPTGQNDHGSATWKVPSAPNGDDYYLSFGQNNAQGTWLVLGDTGNFSISNPQADFLLLTSPTTVNKPQWKAGEAHNITWKYTNYLNFKLNIYCVKDGESGWKTIAQNIPVGSNGVGSYTWNIPQNFDRGDYTLYLDARTTANLLDTQKFAVTAPEYIMLVAPKANDRSPIGRAVGVIWNFSNPPGPNVDIVLKNVDNGAVRTIGQGVPLTKQSYSWPIPADMATGQYRVTVQSPDKSSFQVTSDIFKIVPAAYIKHYAPAAGDSWRIGTTQQITWLYHVNGLNATVNIDLKKGGTMIRNLARGVSLALGQTHASYNWAIPADLEPGDDYQLTLWLKEEDNAAYEAIVTGPSFSISKPPLVVKPPEINPPGTHPPVINPPKF